MGDEQRPPDNAQRVRDLFERACQLDPDERAAFLDKECAGDHELRAMVDSLLAHDRGASQVLGPLSDGDRAGLGVVAPGARLGDFELLRELGRGGMGIVYEARQVSLNRRVALKVLPPGLGLTDPAVQRFEREAKAAAKLHHTNIVSVHAIGEEEGCHYYAMELIEGQSLSQVLHDLRDRGSHPFVETAVTRTAPTEAPEASEPPSSATSSSRASLSDTSSGRKWFNAVATLIAEVADALEYAHGRGVIHRDIKPANLMLSGDGRLCIADFGLARVAQEPGMTVSGSLLGTPAYMSPEQIAVGRVKLDHRTDIYSLGAVLYELLTQQRPFPGESREEVLSAILTKDPRPPRRFNPRIPLDLETICQKAMEKDPDRRYQRAAELAADLRRYLVRGLITAKRASIPRRVWKAARRHPAAATAVLSALLLLAMGAFAWEVANDNRLEVARRVASDARLAFEQGRDKAALEMAEEALAADSDLVDARLLRARVLARSGRAREAVEEAQALLAEDPDNWLAHAILVMAGVALQGEMYEEATLYGNEAQDHLQALEKLAPETADAYYVRAAISESPFDKLDLLNRALALDPGHAEALSLRANVLMNSLMRFDEALADADRLTVARPQAAEGLRLRALIYRGLHDFATARQEISRAIEQDPTDAASYLLSGELRYDKQGLADLERAIELDPRNESLLVNRGFWFWNVLRYDKALADAETALSINGDFVKAHLLRIRALAAQEDIAAAEESIRWLEHTLTREMDPARRFDVVDSLYSSYWYLNDYERMLATMEKLLAQGCGKNQWRCLLYRARARGFLGDSEGASADCLAAANQNLDVPWDLYWRAIELNRTCVRFDLAVADLDRAIELAPKWADPYWLRGGTLGMQGRFDEMLDDLDHAVESAPRWATPYQTRALAHSRLGNFQNVLADTTKLIDLPPDVSLGYCLRGLYALWPLGRIDEALADLDKCVELNPRDAVVLMERAGVQLQSSAQCGLAMAAYEEAMRLGFSDPGEEAGVLAEQAEFQVSGFYYHCPAMYDLNEALQKARRALQLSPSHDVARGTLGRALYRAGLYEEAIEHQLAALDTHPGNSSQLFFLAMEHWQLGRRTEARDYYEQAVSWMDEHAPNDPRLKLYRQEATELIRDRGAQ